MSPQYTIPLFVALLSVLGTCNSKLVVPTTTPSIIDTTQVSMYPTLRRYFADTLLSNCEKYIIDSAGICDILSEPEYCHTRTIRFYKYDTTTCNNFLVLDAQGAHYHYIAVFQNKERIFSQDGDLTLDYYTDTQGNQYPILEMDDYDEGHDIGSDWDCSYRLPVYFYEARAKWTPTSFDIDSLLSVNGGYVLDRYLYDSIALKHELKLPQRKNNKVISVDNFVKIRVTQGGTNSGQVVDTSMCTPKDEKGYPVIKNKTHENITRLTFERAEKIYTGIKSILPIDKDQFHWFFKSNDNQSILIGRYTHVGEDHIIVGDSIAPYKARNVIMGFLEGYYKGADGLPLPVIAHEITMPDYDRTLHVLYRWKGNRIVADSILSLGGLPLTTQMRDSLNRLYVRKNPFEKIKGKNK